MVILPYCIVDLIFSFYSVNDKLLKFVILNKKYSKNCVNILSKIIKIQKFYKNNLPKLPLSDHYDIDYKNRFTKHQLVRFYICNYDMENHLFYILTNYQKIQNRLHYKFF